jgi:hypothetical protein
MTRTGKVGGISEYHSIPPCFDGVLHSWIRESQRTNITDDEVKEFKLAAKQVLKLTEQQLTELLDKGDFVEVHPK